MNQPEKPMQVGAFDRAQAGVEDRIMHVMIAVVVLAVALATFIAPWRVATGLLLGGTLSLLNYYWLRTSVAAIIETSATGATNTSRAVRYILRYLAVAAVVLLAWKLNLVSLAATIFGLCSFVAGLFSEAFRQFYFTMLNREEPN